MAVARVGSIFNASLATLPLPAVFVADSGNSQYRSATPPWGVQAIWRRQTAPRPRNRPFLTLHPEPVVQSGVLHRASPTRRHRVAQPVRLRLAARTSRPSRIGLPSDSSATDRSPSRRSPVATSTLRPEKRNHRSSTRRPTRAAGRPDEPPSPGQRRAAAHPTDPPQRPMNNQSLNCCRCILPTPGVDCVIEPRVRPRLGRV